MNELSSIFYLSMMALSAAIFFAAWRSLSLSRVRTSSEPARHNREDTE